MMNQNKRYLCILVFSLIVLSGWIINQSLIAQVPAAVNQTGLSDQVVKPGDSEEDVLKVLPAPSRVDRVAVSDGIVELWYFKKAGIVVRLKRTGTHSTEVLSSTDLR